MAKRFGKFLLFTAAVGAAAGAAAYYLQKKDALDLDDRFDDEDYDDFSDDTDGKADDTSRNYVPLHAAAADKTDGEAEQKTEKADESKADGFTPLSEKAPTVNAPKSEETIEEFFDEDEADAEEPLD